MDRQALHLHEMCQKKMKKGVFVKIENSLQFCSSEPSEQSGF